MSSRKKVSINLTPGKVVNFHIFKMAAIETIKCTTDCLWFILQSINVLATGRKMGFLNRVNIFSSADDER